MIQVYINNEALDVNQNISISFEHRSPVYMGDTAEQIKGSVAMPFVLPLTRSNAHTLKFVESLGNRKTVKDFDNAKITIKGNDYLNGTLRVKKVSNYLAQSELYGGVGALQNLKTYYLNDEALYASNPNYLTTPVNSSNLIADMNASLTANSDYIFIPFFSEDIEHNEWDSLADSFTLNNPILPFMRVVPLLENILSSQGWSLTWKDKATYDNLVILGNQTISTTAQFKRTDILPRILASDFVKELAALTGHIIITDEVTQNLTFVKYSDLGQGKILDWSSHVLNVVSQEFINTSYTKDISDHQHTYKITSVDRSTPVGTVAYFKDDIIHPEEIDGDNMTKIIFAMYGGKKERYASDPANNGYNSEEYPYISVYFTNTYITNLYSSWNTILADTRLLTVKAALPLKDVINHKFYNIIRIFNQKDGHYYHFLVKTIKQTINTHQHELQELELLLLY